MEDGTRRRCSPRSRTSNIFPLRATNAFLVASCALRRALAARSRRSLQCARANLPRRRDRRHGRATRRVLSRGHARSPPRRRCVAAPCPRPGTARACFALCGSVLPPAASTSRRPPFRQESSVASRDTALCKAMRWRRLRRAPSGRSTESGETCWGGAGLGQRVVPFVERQCADSATDACAAPS
eukprot:1676553-Prymnesium_polylepis.1